MHEQSLCILGICGGPGQDELLLADVNNGMVRALDMRSKTFVAQDTIRCAKGERVWDVLYCWETIFVVTWDEERDLIQLQSFVRKNGDWTIFHILKLVVDSNYKRSYILRGIMDTDIRSLFYSQWFSDTVNIVRILEDGTMQHSSLIQLPATHFGFDVKTFGSETRLAACFLVPTDLSVSLFLLDAGNSSIVQLSRVQTHAVRPLFCGDKLLVRQMLEDDSFEVVSYSTADGQLHRDRVLIPSDKNLDMFVPWCDINQTLLICNYNTDNVDM